MLLHATASSTHANVFAPMYAPTDPQSSFAVRYWSGGQADVGGSTYLERGELLASRSTPSDAHTAAIQLSRQAEQATVVTQARVGVYEIHAVRRRIVGQEDMGPIGPPFLIELGAFHLRRLEDQTPHPTVLEGFAVTDPHTIELVDEFEAAPVTHGRFGRPVSH